LPSANPKRPAVGADHVETCDLAFLAGILGEGRAPEGPAAANKDRAIALPEPFGLNADRTGGGLAAFEPHLEHLHGI
jgi:hypothetical protein